MKSDRTILLVTRCHSECASCQYGRGGWASSPALDGKPVLTPESRECPGCGRTFTHKQDVYSIEGPVLIEAPA